jgi:methionyl-tRNA formyltransferase
MKPIRIIFMGSAELACTSLRALTRWEGGEVLGVVTQPDKPKGRDLKLLPTPVAALAEELNLPVFKPTRARDDSFVMTIRDLSPDLIVVVAYGQILPQALLDVPRFGCLNVHTSILPKYRGAAPIQWAIVDGESETGVTIMKMDSGLDTGDIVSEAHTPIENTDNAQTLHDRLAGIGADQLIKTIPGFVEGSIRPIKQPAEGVTYARKIFKKDGEIDWSRSSEEIFNQVRGFTPWPGAFTRFEDAGKRKLLKIWEVEPLLSSDGAAGEVVRAQGDELIVSCGQGALRLLRVQKEGARKMSVREFLQGVNLPSGFRLG